MDLKQIVTIIDHSAKNQFSESKYSPLRNAMVHSVTTTIFQQSMKSLQSKCYQSKYLHDERRIATQADKNQLNEKTFIKQKVKLRVSNNINKIQQQQQRSYVILDVTQRTLPIITEQQLKQRLQKSKDLKILYSYRSQSSIENTREQIFNVTQNQKKSCKIKMTLAKSNYNAFSIIDQQINGCIDKGQCTLSEFRCTKNQFIATRPKRRVIYDSTIKQDQIMTNQLKIQ